MLGWFKKKFKAEKQTVVKTAAEVEPRQEEVEPPQEVVKVESRGEEAKSEPVVNGSSLLARLKDGLAKTRDSIINRVDDLFLGKKEIDQELFDELEEILITADLGVETTQELIEHARTQVDRQQLSDPLVLKKVLKDKITDFLHSSDQEAELVMPADGPFVIMVVGVNGVGKTTTIGKMARKFINAGQSVTLVAADTFRAAAVDQLKIWGERNGVDVVARQTGDDPSAVVFDAMDQMTKKPTDVVIVDTAGRLHTKVNLMEELKKINKVMGKKMAGTPHEVLLVIDATTGQNGISQARMFSEAVGVTGLALTKLDGTAKGGIVVNICRQCNIPIRFIGVGEQAEDLRDFDADEFAAALFAEADE